MAFRFKRKESIAEGFARIGHEQLTLAATALEEASTESVHVARRAIKRLRSTLRLFQRALPPEGYAAANDKLRTIGRHLSGLRDAQVRLQVMQDLVGKLTGTEVNRLKRNFAAAAGPGKSAEAVKTTIAGAIKALRHLDVHYPLVKEGAGWGALRRSLQVYYRQARKAHAAASAEPTIVTLHTWRRRSKDYENHLQLLRKVDPSTIKRRLRDADRLNDLLGAERDLALTEETFKKLENVPEELDLRLRKRMDRQRAKLQRNAFRVGSSLFFEKPSVVVADLHRRWKQWRRG